MSKSQLIVLFAGIIASALAPTTSGQVITTVAGGAPCCAVGDGGAATAAWVNSSSSIAIDNVGNLLIADVNGCRVRRVSAGVITTVAGIGQSGSTGDGGPATSAVLCPASAVSDGSGNLFIADYQTNLIRRVNASTGIITTVAGNRSLVQGFNGDGQLATAASLYYPWGVAIDGAGNVFIADSGNQRIRRVSASTGLISTVAGNGTVGFGGDGGPATAASLTGPNGIAFDGAGNLIIADTGNNRIRRVSASTGIITTIAGNGAAGFSGENGPATTAALNTPFGIAVDGAGNLFIADTLNHRIRRVDVTTGIISTVAGTGVQGFSGDGGPPIAASFRGPQGVAFDTSGNLLIADTGNARVRRVVSPPPSFSTVLLTFDGQLLGTVSAAQTIVFSNPSASSVLISAITVSGDFVLQTASSNPCSNGLSVAAGGSCNIAVAFAPTTVGARAGNLTVNDNGAGSPRTASLSGTGTQILPALSPNAWDFGQQTVATTSGGKAFTYANQSGGSVTLTNITTASSEFSVQGGGTTPCANSLSVPNGTSCTLTVKFTPADTGVRSATLTITDNATGSPRTAVLTGTGATSNPVPAITNLNPAGVVATAAGVSVTVIGSGFVPGSQVLWNGSSRTTTFVNASTLLIVLLPGDVNTVNGAHNITVFTATPGGGTSNAVGLVVTRAATDNAATAPPVLRTPATLTVTSLGAPASTVAPPCGNGSVSNSVWFSYTAAANGTLTVDSSGSSYQTIIAAYTNNLTGVGCNAAPAGSVVHDGANVALPAHLVVPVTVGTTYLLLATATNGDGGTVDFNVNFTSSAQIPNSSFVTTLPHMVAGAGYITKLTLVNMSGTTNNVVVNFMGQDGSVQSSQTVQMQAAQTVRIASPESARNATPQAIQWVTVGGDGRVAVNLFFEVEDQAGKVINCIGFNDASSVLSFTVPVEFEPKPANASIGRTVGVALANPSANSNAVQLTLTDQNGANLGTRSVPLVAFQQTGIDLSSFTTGFGNVLPAANFIGTLTGTAATPFSVIALGDDFGPFFATPSLTNGTAQVVPHIASGVGYVTKLTFANLSASTNTVTATYFSQAGAQVRQNVFVIPPFGTARDTTGEANRANPALTVNWATVTSTAAAGVNLFFEFIQPGTIAVINTVGFNASPELSTFTIPVEWEPGTNFRTMGFAIANRNGSSASITASLLNSQGAVIATHLLTMGANSQTTFALDTFTEFATVLPATNFIGAVVVTSNLPVSAIALEDDLGPFSAVPVIIGRP